MKTSTRNEHNGRDGEPSGVSDAPTQGEWRGPGEIPGSRDVPGRGAHTFRQPTSGGQIPGELREWDERKDAPPVEPRSAEQRGGGRAASRPRRGGER